MKNYQQTPRQARRALEQRKTRVALSRKPQEHTPTRTPRTAGGVDFGRLVAVQEAAGHPGAGMNAQFLRGASRGGFADPHRLTMTMPVAGIVRIGRRRILIFY